MDKAHSNVNNTIMDKAPFTSNICPVRPPPDTFDGVPFTRYEAGWLLQETNQTLKGHLAVASDMNAQRVVTLSGVTVQGVDVNFLDLFAMRVDESETFLGPVVFGK